MSRMPLDLSKFKKVKSDKHTSTFRHYEGHELTIAHGKLSSKLRDQLSKLPTHVPKAEKPQKFAEGGVVKSGDDFGYIAQAFSPDQSQLQADHDAAMASLPKTPDDIPQPAARQPMSVPQEQPVQTSQAAPVGLTPPDPLAASSASQLGALGEERAGYQANAKAQGDLGAANAQREQEFQKQSGDANQAYNQTIAHLMDQDRKYQSDYAAGHIDPKRYLNSMSTGDKIMSGIGLVLGGIGSGATQGPNLAFQYLQNQIDKDVEAQKADLDKNQNLLSHNSKIMGDVRAGAELTRLQMNDILKSHLNEEAGKSASPIAAAAAQVQSGMIDQKKAEIMHNIAVQKAISGTGAAGADPEQQFQSRMQLLRANKQEGIAKDMEAKHLPGIPGSASVEITPANREQWVQLDNFDKLQKEADEYLKNASSLGEGWQNAHKARGEALSRSMELQVGKLEGLNRFTPEEAKRYKGIIPELAGTHFTGQDSAKLEALGNEIAGHKQSLLESVGLKAPARASAPQYKVSGGVKYMRGPNGEAIAVR